MQWPKLRRLNPFRFVRLRYVVALVVLALAAPPIAIATQCALAKGDPPEALDDPSAVRHAKQAIAGYQRDGASTYLTLPEWYIVYATEEYASALAAEPPSRFPYFNAIVQYWSYYRQMCHPACSRYLFDPGNHLMLAVMGASFTIENALKGVYEATIGRATERFSSTDTDEDRYAAATATEYGRFMHMQPWYEFPFPGKLTGLWSQTPLWGPHLLRKWERRAALSVEYGGKALYGWAIRRATKAVYGDEDEWIYAYADRVPDTVFRDPRVRRVTVLNHGAFILAIRRYELFTGVLPQLAAAGIHFYDIAGNRRILITAVGDREHMPTDNDHAPVLFTMRLLTSNSQRVAIDASVESLGDILKALASSGAVLEHIYDF